MLLKDLGLSIQDILPGRLSHTAPSPISTRGHRSATTAARTGIGSSQSMAHGFSMRDRDAGHDVQITHFNPMPGKKYVIQ